jgi:hypothetical protein
MPPPETPQNPTESLFAPPASSRSFPTAVVAIAAAVVAVAVVAALLLSPHKTAPAPNTLQPAAPYASNLTFTSLAMSQASSFSGAQALYIDGHLANHGASTVTAITVQVVFPNDLQMPPQIQTLPVFLIRTREPYVDTKPLSAAPLAPNAEADFRLSPDPVYQSWNQQLPTIRVISVNAR